VHVGIVLPVFIATEGFPANRAARQSADPLDGLEPRSGRRCDLRRRSRGQGVSATCRASMAVPAVLRMVRAGARPAGSLRRRRGGVDDEHGRGTGGTPCGRSYLNCEAFRWPYVKPNGKLTLLAALLLRSARIFSWTALTLSPSLSALPICQVGLDDLQEAEPLFEARAVGNGTRHATISLIDFPNAAARG